MIDFLELGSQEAKARLSRLLAGTTVLVEVRFPKMGTSPDWFLCEDEEEFNQITERLSPEVEIYVIDLMNLDIPKGTIALKKQTPSVTRTA